MVSPDQKFSCLSSGDTHPFFIRYFWLVPKIQYHANINDPRNTIFSSDILNSIFAKLLPKDPKPEKNAILFASHFCIPLFG